MGDFIFVASAMKLAYALAALLVIVYFLRWLDARAGVSFKELFKDFKNEPASAAQYLGLRFVGACYVVGSILS